MLKDAKGNRLFRKVWIKIIYPDAIFPPKIMTQRAGPKQGFGPTGVDDLLMQTADKLDTAFPYWEFKVTELAPQGRMARFVFTFAGYSPKFLDQAKIGALEGAQLPGAVEGPTADFK